MASYRYSISINYNTASTLLASMNSIFMSTNEEDFEVIVVDNYSSDGSLKLPYDLRNSGRINRLLVRRCSRGMGRQLAFLLSRGKYIIANIDMDVIYSEKSRDVLRSYHKRYKGLLAVYGMVIVLRSIAVNPGGCRDLDRHEDSDLCARAYPAACYVHDMNVSVVKAYLESYPSIVKLILENCVSFQDWFRIGMTVEEPPYGPLMILRPTVFLGFLLHRFYRCYKNPYFSCWFRIWKRCKTFSVIIAKTA